MNQEDLPDATYVQLEFFPAEVEGVANLPKGDLKITATNQHVFIVGGGHSGPEIVFMGVLDEYLGYDKDIRGWHMTLEDGTLLTVTRANSCGCGTRLRGHRLYPGLRRVIH